MRFMSRSGKERSEVAAGPGTIPRNGAVHYDSVVSIDSKAAPGVRFAIYRISFGRRMELSRRVRDQPESGVSAGRHGAARED